MKHKENVLLIDFHMSNTIWRCVTKIIIHCVLGILQFQFDLQAKLLLCLIPKALSSLPGGLCELLRSLHVHSLKNDEVLLLKDSRRLAEHKDAGPQVGDRPFILKECAQSAC